MLTTAKGWTDRNASAPAREVEKMSSSDPWDIVPLLRMRGTVLLSTPGRGVGKTGTPQ
jgi:hypothetical protein